MTLAPDYLEYRSLRGATDCVLAYQVGKFFEFHGPDALTLASIFVLPIEHRWTDANGDPVPMCRVGIISRTSGPDKVEVSFDPDLIDALTEAGYPLAFAHEWFAEDGSVYRKLDFAYRPQLDRPPLRVV